MADEKNVVTISKSYTRKVNLTAISGRFDNIALGTIVSKQVEVSDEKSLQIEMDKVAWLAREATEADIKEAFAMLKGMSEDKMNDGLLGNGTNLQACDLSDTEPAEKKPVKQTAKKTAKKKPDITTIDDLLSDADTSDEPPAPGVVLDDPEEIDLDDFDPGDYEGGILDE